MPTPYHTNPRTPNTTTRPPRTKTMFPSTPLTTPNQTLNKTNNIYTTTTLYATIHLMYKRLFPRRQANYTNLHHPTKDKPTTQYNYSQNGTRHQKMHPFTRQQILLNRPRFYRETTNNKDHHNRTRTKRYHQGTT